MLGMEIWTVVGVDKKTQRSYIVGVYLTSELAMASATVEVQKRGRFVSCIVDQTQITDRYSDGAKNQVKNTRIVSAC